MGGRAGDTLPEANSQNPSKKPENENEAGSSPNHPFSGAVAVGFRECNLESVVLPQKNWKVSIFFAKKMVPNRMVEIRPQLLFSEVD